MAATRPEAWAVCWDGEHIDTFDSEKTARLSAEAAVIEAEAGGKKLEALVFPVSAIGVARESFRWIMQDAGMVREVVDAHRIDGLDQNPLGFRDLTAVIESTAKRALDMFGGR